MTLHLFLILHLIITIFLINPITIITNQYVMPPALSYLPNIVVFFIRLTFYLPSDDSLKAYQPNLLEVYRHNLIY